MATVAQIADLRVMINEPDMTTYPDLALGERIDAAGGALQPVAAAIWREKAGSYAELVDVQEGSSRRSLGSLYANALKMADYYITLGDGSVSPTSRASRTRQITRP